MQPPPYILAIAGGTASGKTTFAEVLVARTGALLISHDRYYRDCPNAEGVNFDHPDALETSLLVEHLDALRRNEPVRLPDYDFVTHRRIAGKEVQPRPIVVVEGILVLADPALVSRCDLTVFMHCPDDVRLLRRLLRDCAERGRTLRSVAEQYLTTVRPMHERFVAPCEAAADMVLDGLIPPEPELVRVLEVIARGVRPTRS